MFIMDSILKILERGCYDSIEYLHMEVIKGYDNYEKNIRMALLKCIKL